MRRVTMRDVARAAGVSPATVSFVINGRAGQSISEATRRKVLRAAAELGYTAHPIARALREGSARIVILDVGDIPRTPLLDTFIDGLGDELSRHGYELLLAFGRPGRRPPIDAVRPRAVIDLPGIYAQPDLGADGGWVDGMAAHYFVQIDYLRAGGHRRIALAMPADADAFTRLMADYARAAARRLDMPAPLPLPLRDPDTNRRTLAAVAPDVTAVAALTDVDALAVLAAAADERLRVPADLAVIGWGDTAESALWRPALTTVRLDAAAYGRRAARQALDLGDGGPASPGRAEIVVRQTA